MLSQLGLPAVCRWLRGPHRVLIHVCLAIFSYMYIMYSYMYNSDNDSYNRHAALLAPRERAHPGAPARHRRPWVFMTGGCSRRGVQWIGVVLYSKLAYNII